MGKVVSVAEFTYSNAPNGLNCIHKQHYGDEMNMASKRNKPSLTAMSNLITERLILAECLIKADIQNGTLAERNLSSFESLHEVTDPNCYVSDHDKNISAIEEELLADYEVEDWICYWQILVDTLDAWLSNHMESNMISYLSETTLRQKFE